MGIVFVGENPTAHHERISASLQYATGPLFRMSLNQHDTLPGILVTRHAARS